MNVFIYADTNGFTKEWKFTFNSASEQVKQFACQEAIEKKALIFIPFHPRMDFVYLDPSVQLSCDFSQSSSLMQTSTMVSSILWNTLSNPGIAFISLFNFWSKKYD